MFLIWQDPVKYPQFVKDDIYQEEQQLQHACFLNQSRSIQSWKLSSDQQRAWTSSLAAQGPPITVTAVQVLIKSKKRAAVI